MRVIVVCGVFRGGHVGASNNCPLARELWRDDGFVAGGDRRAPRGYCTLDLRRQRLLARHRRAWPRAEEGVIGVFESRCAPRRHPAGEPRYAWIGRVVDIVVKFTEVVFWFTVRWGLAWRGTQEPSRSIRSGASPSKKRSVRRSGTPGVASISSPLSSIKMTPLVESRSTITHVSPCRSRRGR